MNLTRKTTRQILAFGSLTGFALISILWTVFDHNQAMDKIWTGWLTLTGTVMGFYFGAGDEE